MNDKIIELIKAIAANDPQSSDVDFNVHDYAGGNIDDAYGIGFDDGRIELARELLVMITNDRSKLKCYDELCTCSD